MAKPRIALASGERGNADESTPRLYAMMARRGEADSACHLAMARHHAHADDLAAARGLLEAVNARPRTARALTRGITSREEPRNAADPGAPADPSRDLARRRYW